MSVDINLIIDRRDRVRQDKVFKKIQFTSFCGLFLLLIVSSIIFILNLNSPFEALLTQKQDLQNQLTSIVGKEQKYNFVAGRIKDIDKIVTARVDFDAYIDLIATQIPAGVSVKELQIKKNKSIVLHASSLSLIALSEMLDKFSDLGKRDKQFAKIAVQELSLDFKQGGYNVTMTIGK